MGKAAGLALLLAGCGPAPAATPSAPPEAAEGRVVRKPATVALQGSVRGPKGFEVPAGTRVWLATAGGLSLDPAVEALTDADGKWAIDKAPAGRHLVFATARAGDRELRLATIAQASAALPSVRLTLGSTLVVEAWRIEQPRAVPAFDQGAYDRTVYDIDRAYKDREPPDPADPRAALAAVTADVPGLPALAEALGFPRP